MPIFVVYNNISLKEIIFANIITTALDGMRYSLFTASTISSYCMNECRTLLFWLRILSVWWTILAIMNNIWKAMSFCRTHGIRKTCERTWSTTSQNVGDDVRGHGHCIDLTVSDRVHVQWVFLSAASKNCRFRMVYGGGATVGTAIWKWRSNL